LRKNGQKRACKARFSSKMPPFSSARKAILRGHGRVPAGSFGPLFGHFCQKARQPVSRPDWACSGAFWGGSEWEKLREARNRMQKRTATGDLPESSFEAFSSADL
jgi:hypothetical protein